MSGDMFSHILSNDKSKLKLVLNSTTVELSAEQVARLALFFANLRAEMSPELPNAFPGPQTSAQSDHYEIQQNPETGESEIRLRIPGLIWSFAYFSKEESVRLSEVLNPKASGLEKSKLN